MQSRLKWELQQVWQGELRPWLVWGHLKAAIRSLSNHEFEYTHGKFIIRHEPIGVCGLITPWNWPVNQVVSKLAPCIATGCTAILKPSEIAPLSSMVIAEILHEANVPSGSLIS